jgi:hypothetical protein
MGDFKGTRNENGRPKGTPNKDTAEIRANFQLLIEGNLEQLETDLKELKPYERIKVILELSKFVIPTLKATELTASVNDNRFQPLVINMIKEDEVRKIANELNEKY